MKARYFASLLLAFAAPAGAGETALLAAVRAGDEGAVTAALAAGADPDPEVRPMEMTPLALAVARGDLRIAQVLLDHGADPDSPSLRGANALSVAVRSCKAGVGMLDLLLAAGADLENRSGNGVTPLLVAVGQERRDMALRLLAAGADVQALTPFGDGVLNFAIYVQDPVLIGAALDHGVSHDQLDRLFQTVAYDPPGWHGATGHHEGLCQK